MKEVVYTFYEQIIIDNIDLEPYDISNDGYLYDKIKTTYNIFKKEYGFMIPRVGEVNAFKEWLMGLPSVLTVPFLNSEILSLSKENGLLNVRLITNHLDGTTTDEEVYAEGRMLENIEDRVLNRYWTNLALAFFNLKDNL
jgi:hypothetical protein